MLEVVPQEKIPSKQEAQQIIRVLAKNDQISWTKHSKERMCEREISLPAVKNCLEKGIVAEHPFRVFEQGGGYRVTVEKRTAGKFLRVVVTLKYTQKILVITAIWVGDMS